MRSVTFLSIAALAGLVGCAVPSADRRRLLDSMIGKSTVDVVREFGVPTQSFPVREHTFLAYVNDTSYYSPGSYGLGYGWRWGRGGFGPGGWGDDFGSTYVQSACQTSFDIKEGHVIGWSIHGDGC